MHKLLALDEQVFPPSHRIDAQTTRQRLSVNSCTDLAVMDGEELMGYISLYPIPREIYLEIRSGTFDERRVEEHTLPYRRYGRYDAYLCGMAIDKSKYPRLKARFLFGLLGEHLQRLRRRGFFIERIIAHAVSPAGARTLAKMRFRERRAGIYVYDCLRQGLHFIRTRPVFSPRLSLFILPKLVDV